MDLWTPEWTSGNPSALPVAWFLSCAPLWVSCTIFFEHLMGQLDWEGAFKSPPEGARPEGKVPVHSLWTGTESAQGPILLESSSHSSPTSAAFEVAKHPFPGTAILVSKCCSSGDLASFVSVSQCPQFPFFPSPGFWSKPLFGLVFLCSPGGGLPTLRTWIITFVTSCLWVLKEGLSRGDTVESLGLHVLGAWAAAWSVAINEVSPGSVTFCVWAPEELLASPSPTSFLEHGGDSNHWLGDTLCTLGWLICLSIIK